MFVCFLLGSAVAYNIVMIIYRLHFHKLSRFPGPRLAAATGLYEIYFSVWGPGIFEYEIDNMHRKFGPVVRITPDEVHIQEPFKTSSYSDDWIKGTGELESGHYQGGSVHNFQYKRPSISRARSLLRVEVNHIINTLIEKHQAHRMFSSRLGLFLVSPWSEKKVQPVGDTSQSKFTPTL
ncbi:Cytochrome P450 [Penicillium camemberti]|uniref:Cytochrome P450 n=1 Tax=Penicillium camemberti (strain FM 013) TaxID=1429867 RepID=A0A0G4P212_PENC3|nr:Cytochrome P450 [Penicillium camemberti]